MHVWKAKVLQPTSNNVQLSSNGFLHGSILAYHHQHRLRTRLENVGFAMQSQHYVYISFCAEDLRTMFVAYADKVDLIGHLHTGNGDTGDLARNMESLIEKNALTQGNKHR